MVDHVTDANVLDVILFCKPPHRVVLRRLRVQPLKTPKWPTLANVRTVVVLILVKSLPIGNNQPFKLPSQREAYVTKKSMLLNSRKTAQCNVVTACTTPSQNNANVTRKINMQSFPEKVIKTSKCIL